MNRGIKASLSIQVVSRTSTLMGYKLELVAPLFHREIHSDVHQSLPDAGAAVLVVNNEILDAGPWPAATGHVRHDEKIKSGHDRVPIRGDKDHSGWRLKDLAKRRFTKALLSRGLLMHLGEDAQEGRKISAAGAANFQSTGA